MAFNNIIPNEIILNELEKIKKEPKQLHIDIDVFAPLFSIDETALTACNEAFTWITAEGKGPYGTISKSVDHPAFAALRSHLDACGYIKIERGWTNGDRVLKPFYLNKVYFETDDQFVCAAAMKGHLDVRRKYDKDRL